MRIDLKERGTAIAIGLGVLAVFLAGTGTAVAVTATVVNITDPVTAKAARVDATGRLSVAPAPSTISGQVTFTNNGTTPITSPTSATLVLTDLRVSETRLNLTTNGSDLTVILTMLAVDPASGACTTTALRYLASTDLSSGLDRDLLGSARPQVKVPAGHTRYCLGIYSYITNGGADATPFYPRVSWSGYVASGSYTGAGTGAAAADSSLVPDGQPSKS